MSDNNENPNNEGQQKNPNNGNENPNPNPNGQERNANNGQPRNEDEEGQELAGFLIIGADIPFIAHVNLGPMPVHDGEMGQHARAEREYRRQQENEENPGYGHGGVIRPPAHVEFFNDFPDHDEDDLRDLAIALNNIIDGVFMQNMRDAFPNQRWRLSQFFAREGMAMDEDEPDSGCRSDMAESYCP